MRDQHVQQPAERNNYRKVHNQQASQGWPEQAESKRVEVRTQGAMLVVNVQVKDFSQNQQ
jgi:hypothetical protein